MFKHRHEREGEIHNEPCAHSLASLSVHSATVSLLLALPLSSFTEAGENELQTPSNVNIFHT